MKKTKTPQVLNPNWASVQQNLKSHGQPPKRRLSSSDDVNAKTLATTSESNVLGKRKERDEESSSLSSSILLPTSSDVSLTDALAMDCEMVGVSSQGNKSALGRVTLVNEWGNVVYDQFVRPLEPVVDFRTNISGIHPWNLKKAKDFMTVQRKVAELIKGRILVGHALHNDLKVLLLSHPKKDTRDTTSYQPLLGREGRRRALKDLAAQILGVRIQQRQHCPIQDARAAMLIYKKYQKEWEKSIKKLDTFKKKLKNKKRKNPAAKGTSESHA